MHPNIHLILAVVVDLSYASTQTNFTIPPKNWIPYPWRSNSTLNDTVKHGNVPPSNSTPSLDSISLLNSSTPLGNLNLSFNSTPSLNSTSPLYSSRNLLQHYSFESMPKIQTVKSNDPEGYEITFLDPKGLLQGSELKGVMSKDLIPENILGGNYLSELESVTNAERIAMVSSNINSVLQDLDKDEQSCYVHRSGRQLLAPEFKQRITSYLILDPILFGTTYGITFSLNTSLNTTQVPISALSAATIVVTVSLLTQISNELTEAGKVMPIDALIYTIWGAVSRSVAAAARAVAAAAPAVCPSKETMLEAYRALRNIISSRLHIVPENRAAEVRGAMEMVKRV